MFATLTDRLRANLFTRFPGTARFISRMRAATGSAERARAGAGPASSSSGGSELERTVCEEDVEQVYGPSHTTDAELMYFFRSARKHIRSHYESIINGDVARGRRYYAELYSTSLKQLGQSSWWEVKDATVYAPRGLVVLDNGNILTEAMFENTLQFCTRDFRFDGKGNPPVQERVLSLLAPFSDTHNYAHWLMDSMTKLSPFSPPFEFSVLIPPRSPGFVRSSLRHIGFEDRQIVEAREGSNKCKTLIVSRVQARTGEPKASSLLRLRELMGVGDAAGGTTERKRIYISRKAAVRGIVNEEELEPVLKRFGFQSVQTETLSFSEQVRLFSEADFILGAHGAGMLNSIFSPPGTIVMEIYNEKRWDPPCKKISFQLGHPHWHVWGTNVGSRWETHVNPERLGEAVRSALALRESMDCR